MLDALAAVGGWSAFAARALAAAGRAAPKPGLWARPLYGVLVGALPLALVLGLTLGAVIWMQTRSILERTAGAADLLPTVLAAAVLLELAPVGAGLILASRSGASLGAELSSMQLGEQIDALRLLGVDVFAKLVGPRVLACVVAGPVLHTLISAVALGSGFAAELLTGQTTLLKYQTAVLGELRLGEVVASGGKTLVFGWLVGATGCLAGLGARGGSEGVGRAATGGVVACCLLVLAADVVLVGLIRAV